MMKVTPASEFGSCSLLLLAIVSAWLLLHRRRQGKKWVISVLWALGMPFSGPQSRARGFLQSYLCIVLFTSTLVVFTLSCCGEFRLRKPEENNNKLIVSLVVLQILTIGPNMHAAINFSDSSNSCTMYSVHVL